MRRESVEDGLMSIARQHDHQHFVFARQSLGTVGDAGRQLAFDCAMGRKFAFPGQFGRPGTRRRPEHWIVPRFLQQCRRSKGD